MRAAPPRDALDAPARADVCVVGAGPAGSALAARLADRGLAVVLVERDAFPRDKLCGEFLSPEAVARLDDLGCRAALAALRPPPVTSARITLPSGFALDAPLPGVGWGLSRLALDAALAAHARRRGVVLLEGVTAAAVRPAAAGLDVVVAPTGAGAAAPERRAIRAGLVVGAYGRWNRLDRAARRAGPPPAAGFVGLKRHFGLAAGAAGAATAAALDGRVELHAFDGGYCGLTRIEGGAVNACLLVARRVVGRAAGAGGGPLGDGGGPRGAGGDGLAGAARWDAVVGAAGRANPALGARLAGLVAAPDSAVHAVSPVPFDTGDRGGSDCLFVGDAAGMIPPLAGDGQAMALEGALLLAEQLAGALAPGAWLDAAARARLAAAWDGAWRRAFGRRMRLARALQPLLLSPRRAEPAARVVAAVPGAAAWLARATRG